MLFESKVNRTLAVIAIAVGSAVAPALAASAVTNPADNPYPITVTGDDGNTYVDGQDTLPGFDDEECTYIPGAYFDFANNRVHYADGKSIPWSEWDRATGYQAWLAAQGAVRSPSATPAPSKSAVASSKTTKTSKSTSGVASPQPTASASATAAAGTVVNVEFGQLYVPVQNQNPGRLAGLAILSFLFVTGVLITIGHELRQRFIQKGND